MINEKSLKNLVSGKNKKPGSKRTTIILSGAAQALAKLKGATLTDGIETALKKASTLSDKAQLIHEGKWKMPVFDEEYGFLMETGWEGINYEGPTLYLDPSKSLEEQFNYATAANVKDPLNIQWAIESHGFEATVKYLSKFDFDGYPIH